MHKSSWNTYLLEFSLGERRYIETTLIRYASDMRTINTPKSRRPAELEGREFTTSLYTAVSSNKAGDIRYLISVERVK